MIADLIRDHGTDSQRERFAEARLPEAELRDILRAVLFRPLDGFARFRRLEPSDLRHAPDCVGPVAAVAQFKVEDDYHGPLSAPQWATWKMLNDSFRQDMQPLTVASQVDVLAIKMRWHVAECAHCEATKQRPSALVSIRFSGMALSREYAL